MPRPINRGLTRRYILQFLRYDRERGKLYWLPRSPDMFTDGTYSRGRKCAAWNGLHVGRHAGSLHSSGYFEIELDGIKHKEQNLIWCIEYDVCPELELDHKDEDKINNRIGNLRLATESQNRYNVGLRRDNTSGHKGICKRPNGRWQYQIRIYGKRKTCTCDAYEQACAGYDAMARKHHGEFVHKSSLKRRSV